MSSSLGFASGVLIATIAFEMMPKAIELGSVIIATGGFSSGFGAVYAFDLFVHHWRLAGRASEQRRAVQLFYGRRRPRTGDVAVFAGGTSVEELIEGMAIGAGTIVDPGFGLMVALAIAIDNISEGLSIGETVRSESSAKEETNTWEVLGWTSTIGLALLISSLAGWFLLRGLPEDVLAFMFATGGGGMFYLTMTDLFPQAEARQYQESAAIANGVGFLVIFILSAQLS